MHGISRNLFNSTELSTYINTVNTEFTRIASLDHVPLGPAFKTLCFEDAANNLILHRISKKFVVSESKVDKERARNSVNDFFLQDSQLQPFRLPDDPFVRKTLYEVRNQIHSSLTNYVLDSGSVEITNGETFKSARGDTSIYAKLRDRDQWTVTPECFDLFAGIAYRNHGLKRLVKAHFKRMCATRDRYVKYGKIAYRNFLAGRIPGKDVGFAIFRDILRNVVTFVGGSRITTVPKDKDKDRVILCEAMCNMITQRVIAAGIRKCLKITFGYDLQQGQQLHNLLIHLTSSATIDLRNASNSNVLAVVEWLMGDTRLFRHLTGARASHVFYEDDVHCLRMMSPMGNGFTFELMTFILMHFARAFDSMASVFGDDIIIHQDCAHSYIEVLKAMQWQINEDKTFIDGPFKESCGGFVYDGNTLRSFDVHFASDIVTAVINTNKLKLLAESAYGVVRDILIESHRRLIKAAPLLLLGDSPKETSFQGMKDQLHQVIWCDPKLRKRLHKQNDDMRILFKKVTHKHRGLIQDLAYNTSDLYVSLRFQYSAIKYKFKPQHNVNVFWSSYYLYTGRCTTPTYRKVKVTSNVTLREANSSNIISTI